jgi:hypothetical protein
VKLILLGSTTTETISSTDITSTTSGMTSTTPRIIYHKTTSEKPKGKKQFYKLDTIFFYFL